MTEILKETVRILLFPLAVMCGGEFYAEEGSWFFRLLIWAYGEDVMEELD